MDQKEIWNSIAQPWRDFRNIKPIEEVSEFLKNKSGNILDLGCGSGRNLVKLDSSTIYGVDFSNKMLEFAKEYANQEGITFEARESNAWTLDFKENFFDAAIFIAVLHCIPSEEKREKSLKELFRVMKKNAEAFISVWDKNQPRFENSEKESFVPWKHEGEEFQRYYYLYEREEIVDLLKEAGFEIVRVNDSKSPDGFYSRKNINIIVRKP